MYKYLTTAQAYIPLLPPIGDIPENDAKGKLIEYLSWNNKEDEEIKFIFPFPIKRDAKISVKDLSILFNYKVEIITTAEEIEDAASRSIFLVEQVLDTSSFFCQAASKILNFISIVNLTQIEEVISKDGGEFERGFFRKQKLSETKAFPPGRMVFLTEDGIKNIGKNMFWFRRGLTEFSILFRFVSFFTALIELQTNFQQTSKKDKSCPTSVKDYVENSLGFAKGSFKKWSDIRNDIVHFSGRKKDYRNLTNQTKPELVNLYEAAYYSIGKFLTDTPPPPSPLIFYDDLEKEIVKADAKMAKEIKEVHNKRSKGYEEIVL